MKGRIAALVVADLRILVRDGEQLLLTLLIPLGLLVFFSTVDVLPTGTEQPVDFLAPGILALALLSVAFSRLAISLGFDRSFGALARFAVTPLASAEFIAAKILVTTAAFALMSLALSTAGLLLGWQPSISALLIPTVALGIVSFCGLAFWVAGLFEGLKALAVANGLYVVLLLVSGLVFDLERLPQWLATAVKGLPSTALAELFRANLSGQTGPVWAWAVLTIWALAAPLTATKLFSWD